MNTKNTDHLANERTFLAYVRTALAFIAFGFVIARFSLFTREISSIAHIHVPDSHQSVGFGIGMAAAGMVFAIYGAMRFARTNAAIVTNETCPMPVSSATLTAAAIAAIAIVVGVALFQVR